MAPRISKGINGPQLAAGSAPTKRMTRSQSRDISDSEEARVGYKPFRPAQGGLLENAQGNTRQTTTRARGPGHSNEDDVSRDLSIVHEDTSAAYPDLQQSNDTVSQLVAKDGRTSPQSQSGAKSSKRVSAFSGTTARTSRSAQEFSDISADGMVDALEDLSQDSDKVLNFLIPSRMSDAFIVALSMQLQSKGSREKKKLTRLFETLSVHQKMYGDDSYIAIHEVLRTMHGAYNISDDDAGAWRPHALLQKANLAIIASRILSRSWHDQDFQSLVELDQIFPMPFAVGLVPSNTSQTGYSALANETFQFALDIRTQYAVMLLTHYASQPNFDSDIVLRQIFYKDARSLRGWSILGLHSEDLTDDVKDTIITRLEHLREGFLSSSEKQSTSGIEVLQAKFPWDTFVLRAAVWIRQRLSELQIHISICGGAEGVLKALHRKIQQVTNVNSSVKDEIVLEYEAPPEALHALPEPPDKAKNATKVNVLKMGHFSTKSPKATAAAARLRQLDEAVVSEKSSNQNTHQVDSGGQVTATERPAIEALIPQRNVDGPIALSSQPARSHQGSHEDESWREQEAGDDEEIFSDQHLRHVGSQIYAVAQARQVEGNKENIEVPRSQTEVRQIKGPRGNFIDRQPNAQRVIFDDFEEPSQDFQSAQPGPPDEAISDEGFGAPQSVPKKAADRRNQKPSTRRPASHVSGSRGPSPKKARGHDAGRSSRLEVFSDRPSVEPSPSPHDEFVLVNTQAKKMKNIRRKSPQRRRPWSDDETARLINLIETLGTSWSLLMGEDESTTKLLQERGQVGLKDKARNIKIDYLRASRILPTNFEHIPISKIQMDRLKADGIDYDPELGQRVDAEVDQEF